MKIRNTSLRARMLAVTVAGSLAFALAACGGGSSSAAGSAASSNAGVLTIGMTAGDIPDLDTVLASQQGYEGYRFVGNTLYDGLTKFDLKQGTETPKVIPGLAESWVPNADGSVWTFKLRSGVKFHDGTDFNADAVIFNLDRYTNKTSPNYYQAVATSAALTAGSIASYKKIDESTVQISLHGPDGHFPSDLVFVYMASPTAVKKEGNEGFANNPVGTGPFIFKSLSRGQQVIFTPNKDYWGGAPKINELVLKPIPDVAARTAALKAGEVNWIEAPNPDDIATLQSAGFVTYTNSYDHVWPWLLNEAKPPLNNVKVRQAMEYAIDRGTMATDLLHGTADPAYQIIPRANTAYDKANDVYNYDPAKAKKLLAEAGFPNGFKLTLSYPTSGSGNMQPGPMNQLLQSDLAKVGITVELKPVEWATMISSMGAGKIPDDAMAINVSLTFIQESFWSLFFSSTGPYAGLTHYTNPQIDALLGKAASTTDDTARAAIYTQIGKLLDADAVWLDIVNDRNPRTLAPNVKGFIEPKSWFVDLTTITVG